MPQVVLPQVCPRCKGSMIPETDRHGKYATCFVCGYVYEPTHEDARLEIEVDQQEKNKGERKRGRRPSHGQGKNLIKL